MYILARFVHHSRLDWVIVKNVFECSYCFHNFIDPNAINYLKIKIHVSQVSLLASATLKEVATARAREIVAEAYTTIYNAFNNPNNMYEAHTYAAKPPDQIRLLLC